MRRLNASITWVLVCCLLLGQLYAAQPCHAQQSSTLHDDFDNGVFQSAGGTLLAGGVSVLSVEAILLLFNSPMYREDKPTHHAAIVFALAATIAGGVCLGIAEDRPPSADTLRTQAFEHGENTGVGDGLMGLGGLLVTFGGWLLISKNKNKTTAFISIGLGLAGIAAGAIFHVKGKDGFDDLLLTQQPQQQASPLTFPLLVIPF